MSNNESCLSFIDDKDIEQSFYIIDYMIDDIIRNGYLGGIPQDEALEKLYNLRKVRLILNSVKQQRIKDNEFTGTN